MATAQSGRGILYSTLNPKYLHSNSTSHIWPFGAIAELIDNAYDPDVRAKKFWIDKTVVKGQTCLSFMDDGNGLDHKLMHKMLSFGYSEKTAVGGVQPIGIFGNGFKSGSMRLGKDAIVFSRSKSTSCIGMLSQTYLAEIGAEQISVPIVCFGHTETSAPSVQKEYEASLRDILQYSPYKTMEELLSELSVISPPWSKGKTGTRIIIWNLKKSSAAKLEFDFETDRYDIRLPTEEETSSATNKDSYIPECTHSLRAYCSILYLKPRMQIIIRSVKVKSQLISKSLASSKKDSYKPTCLKRSIPITFGYNTKSKDQYGIMMYHKNRLIKAYKRVGCQNRANNQGVGIIGIIECNFLEPTHNKQSFNETDNYRKLMLSLGAKVQEYWKEVRYRWSRDNPNSSTTLEATMKQPDQTWVQCDDCSRWRRLPDGIDYKNLPEQWFCHMNPDCQFRSCHVEEEPVDSEDEQPSYPKTYKQKEKEEKEKKRQKEEEERLRQIVEQLTRPTPPRSQTPPSSGSAIQTDALQEDAVGAEAAPSSSIPQEEGTPSTSLGLPIISNVRSLSAPHLRRKRPLPVTPEGTPKRPKVSKPRWSIWDKSGDPSPARGEDDQSAGSGGDMAILGPSDQDANVASKCAGKNPAGTSPTGGAVKANVTPALPPKLTNTTTQTMVLTVKQEDHSQAIEMESANGSTGAGDANGKASSPSPLSSGTESNSSILDELALPAAAQGEENATEDQVVQVDLLMRELEQSVKERERLRALLDNVLEENEALVDQSAAEDRRKLIALRRKVARLLLPYKTDLALDEVNYEGDDIDEILEQVLSEQC